MEYKQIWRFYTERPSAGVSSMQTIELSDDEAHFAFSVLRLSVGENVELAVVKDGAQGAWVCHRGEALHIPTRRVQVVDTTGAGDLFAGGFLLGLVRGKPLQVCGQLGTLLASDTVTHMGVRLTNGIELQARQLLS